MNQLKNVCIANAIIVKANPRSRQHSPRKRRFNTIAASPSTSPIHAMAGMSGEPTSVTAKSVDKTAMAAYRAVLPTASAPGDWARRSHHMITRRKYNRACVSRVS